MCPRNFELLATRDILLILKGDLHCDKAKRWIIKRENKVVDDFEAMPFKGKKKQRVILIFFLMAR